jgi:hypothetical protein
MKNDQDIRLECLRQAVALTAREGVKGMDALFIADRMFKWAIGELDDTRIPAKQPLEVAHDGSRVFPSRYALTPDPRQRESA